MSGCEPRTLTMEIIGRSVVVPCSLAALFTGIVQSLGTPWGLFRHYWVVVKLVLALLGTLILLVHMRTVTSAADLAAQMTVSSLSLRPMQVPLVVHAAGGLLVLLTATVLSVYKPWGKTAYGRRPHTDGAIDSSKESVRL